MTRLTPFECICQLKKKLDALEYLKHGILKEMKNLAQAQKDLFLKIFYCDQLLIIEMVHIGLYFSVFLVFPEEVEIEFHFWILNF